MAQIWDPATGQLVEVPNAAGPLSGAPMPVPRPEAANMASSAAPSPMAGRSIGAFVQQQQAGAPWGPNAVRDGVDPRLVQFLDRVHPDIPGGFNITSGYRDAANNRRVGGASGSRHIQGQAIDASGFRDDNARALFLQRVAEAGNFRGIGVYPNGSIHIDTRETPAAWGPRGYRGSPVETFPTWAQPHVRSVLGLPASPAVAQASAPASSPIPTSAVANMPMSANIVARAPSGPDNDPAGGMGSQRPMGMTLNSTPASVASSAPATPPDPTRTWRNPMGMPTATVDNTPVSQSFDPNNMLGSFQKMGQNTNFTGGIMGIARAMGVGRPAQKEDVIQSSGALRDTGDAQRAQAAQQMMAALLQRKSFGA